MNNLSLLLKFETQTTNSNIRNTNLVTHIIFIESVILLYRLLVLIYFHFLPLLCLIRQIYQYLKAKLTIYVLLLLFFISINKIIRQDYKTFL